MVFSPQVNILDSLLVFLILLAKIRERQAVEEAVSSLVGEGEENPNNGLGTGYTDLQSAPTIHFQIFAGAVLLTC